MITTYQKLSDRTVGFGNKCCLQLRLWTTKVELIGQQQLQIKAQGWNCDVLRCIYSTVGCDAFIFNVIYFRVPGYCLVFHVCKCLSYQIERFYMCLAKNYSDLHISVTGKISITILTIVVVSQPSGTSHIYT